MTTILASSRMRRGGWTLAGAGFAVMLSASVRRFAGCTGTGALAVNGPQGVTPFLPFASGGAVASLVSAINTANTAFLTQSTAFVSAPPNPPRIRKAAAYGLVRLAVRSPPRTPP